MTRPTTPATEAGRRLLADWMSGNVLNRLPEHGGLVSEQITRIEAEAAEAASPSARELRTVIRALLAASPSALDVCPDWIIARTASAMHVAGEGEDCDPDTDAMWCKSCWIDACNWLDPSIPNEADAEYARLTAEQEEGEPDDHHDRHAPFPRHRE